MRTLASFLVAASVMLAASSTFAQSSMEKNGMAGDSMNKEPATSPRANPAPMKKEDMGDPMGRDAKRKDPMGKDSMSKDSLKENPMSGKPTSM